MVTSTSAYWHPSQKFLRVTVRLAAWLVSWSSSLMMAVTRAVTDGHGTYRYVTVPVCTTCTVQDSEMVQHQQSGSAYSTSLILKSWLHIVHIVHIILHILHIGHIKQCICSKLHIGHIVWHIEHIYWHIIWNILHIGFGDILLHIMHIVLHIVHIIIHIFWHIFCILNQWHTVHSLQIY